MDSESLKIFDDNRKKIGVATREDVHRQGYWHETFHCWFVKKKAQTHYIYLQLRSGKKADYPNLLDITAAGHILADETIEDGVREVKEETGISVSFDDMISIGVIPYTVIKETFIDRELSHVFLYVSNHSFDEFDLQTDEVSGIVRANFNEFSQLWLGQREHVNVEGFEVNHAGERVSVNKSVGKEAFVPHDTSYY